MPDKFLIYAQMDSCFASWMRLVDKLCQRFLDTDFFALGGSDEPWADPYQPRDFYDEGMSPAMYFSLILVPELRAQNGSDFIDSIIAQNAKWGR